jgi:hypothetical protein
MKPVEEYFKYLKSELSKNDSPFFKLVLEKIENWTDYEDLKGVNKMLFFIQDVEGVKIATFSEWQRID